MAIDFGQFVYRPRPLQQWNIGEGFNSIIEGNRERARQAQQESQYARTRSDNQATNAADLAIKQSDIGYEDKLKKYARLSALDAQARAAWAAGKLGDVRALGGAIRELGGTFNEIPVAGGLPDFDIQIGDKPSRDPLDIPGARRTLYGPGFGPGGQRNPMDPPALPGASAAALPGQPAPPPPGGGAQPNVPPPPGPARSVAPPGASWLPPGVDPGPQPNAQPSPPDATTVAGAEAPPAPPPGAAAAQPGASTQAGAPQQATQPGSPQLTGTNPTTPPALSPYRLNTNALVAENQRRLQGYLEGVQKAIPPEYQSRLDSITKHISSLNLPPEDSLKLYQQALGPIVSLMRANINREATQASLGLRGQSMENTRNDRLMRNAQTRTDVIGKKYQLPENINRWQSIDDVRTLLSKHSGPADTQAISMLRNLYQTGVMTDKDFENVKSGTSRTIWQKIKDGTIETFVANGINPDSRAALMDIVEIAKQSSVQKIRTAQSQMLATVRNPRTSSAEERDYYINSIAQSIPESLWDPMIAQSMGIPLDQKSGPMDQSGNFPVKPAAGGENLGTSGLPSTLDGKTSASAKVKKSKVTVMVDGKPKTKDELTEADLDRLTVEQLEQLLGDEGQ